MISIFDKVVRFFSGESACYDSSKIILAKCYGFLHTGKIKLRASSLPLAWKGEDEVDTMNPEADSITLCGLINRFSMDARDEIECRRTLEKSLKQSFSSLECADIHTVMRALYFAIWY